MALQTWTRDQLQALVFSLLGQQDSADNDLLTAQAVQDALYLGEVQFATETLAYRRTASLLAVDEQREYALPEDCVAVDEVTWDDDDTPLTRISEAELALNDPAYLQFDSGDPEYWYPTRPGYIAFYPKTNAPDGDETISIPMYVKPLSIGDSISGATWTGNVSTFTTTTAHKLRAGDSVTVSGVTPTGYNGAYTIVSVPTATTFTVADTVDPTAYVSGGYAYYTSGSLPMLASTDVSTVPRPYRQAPAFYAAWFCANTYLWRDAAAVEAGNAALNMFALLARQYLGETAL